MEVHHHSHTARKKWTHYFWEFLMLFLAVTLGFFVENQREHYVENQRARQYALFLHSDLIKDTANLSQRIEYMASGIKQIDILISLLKSPAPETFTKKIYELSTYSYSNPLFTANNSTMEQLKSSGSLRYFRSNTLVRYFSDYDNEILNMKTIDDRNLYVVEDTRRFLTQFLDLKGVPLPRILRTDTLLQEQSSVPVVLRLYKKEPAQFEQYANLCVLKQVDWINRMRLMIRTLKSARNLIQSLKEEYHLK
ncbi:MAG TPA: hypothetical protein VFH08_02415 [Chitinophagaceae bacterium]|nr:hypothetical protein [Chitinophagaceae bacterium]